MAATEANIRPIIQKCKAKGVTPVIMTSPINPDYAVTEFAVNSGALANDANRRIPKLAAEENVLIVDQYRAIR